MSTPTRYPQTLPELFQRALLKYADRTAVRDDERSLTYGELDERSARLASALARRGVGSEDRVGVLLRNQAAFPVVDLGVMRAGATRLPLNPQHSADELEYLLGDARAEVVVCDDRNADTVVDLSESLDALETVVVVDGDDGQTLPEEAAERHHYDEFLATEPDASALATPDPGAVAGHFYTGGTTGKPKGVRYSHRCLVENLQAHLLEFGFSGDDLGLLAPPLSHSAGTFCWAALIAGGTVRLQDGVDPRALLNAVESAGVTWTFLVPTMLYRLLDSRALESADLSSLDRVLYGAAPMRTDRLEEAIDRIGPVFHQFYGQTEVPNLIATFPPEEHARAIEAGDTGRLASAGTPCLRATVEVRDRETGEQLPAGESGEVVVAAPYAFDGYFERPEATRETLQDGWVRTGDIGVFDDEGYLTLLDRTSDVIVSGGMNVYSRNVERVVRDHPAVENAVVVGVPHDEWGEAVHAVVVADSEELDREELRSFVGERLAGYKKPKSIEIVDSLPTTPLGKTDRSAVRDRYWEDEDRSIH